MNIANSRFTIATIAVAACAMVALVVAAPAQAQTAAPAAVSVQRIVIVGKRIAEPGVQRIVIVGHRQPSERVAAAAHRAPAL